MNSFRTGVSGEYHVFSLLLRKGFDAYITVGHTKAIDLLYHRGGARYTIDVKTSEFDDDFMIGGIRKSRQTSYLSTLAVPNHTYIFVSYLGRITDHAMVPTCYVVPSASLHTVVRVTSGNRAKAGVVDPMLGVSVNMKLLKAGNFLHAWHLL